MVVLSILQYVVFRTGGFERNLDLIPNKKREETEMRFKSHSIRPGSAGRTKTQCGCSKTSLLEVILAPSKDNHRPDKGRHQAAAPTCTNRLSRTVSPRYISAPRFSARARPSRFLVEACHSSGWKEITRVQTWWDPGNRWCV